MFVKGLLGVRGWAGAGAQATVTVVLRPSGSLHPPALYSAWHTAQTHSTFVMWLDAALLTGLLAPKGLRLGWLASDWECPFQRKAGPALKAQRVSAAFRPQEGGSSFSTLVLLNSPGLPP